MYVQSLCPTPWTSLVPTFKYNYYDNKLWYVLTLSGGLPLEGTGLASSLVIV